MAESEINVKVRLGTEVLYNTKIRIALELPVCNLKSKMCQFDDSLVLKRITVVYCGCVMEDSTPLYMYDLFDGATVHLFKEIKPEKIIGPKTISEPDIAKLGAAFRSISLNSSFKAALIKLTKPEVIHNIILTTPGLNEDPVAITLLQHPELLSKINDYEAVKRLADNHPALASAALKIASAVHEEDVQNRFAADIARSMINNGSDEDIEDLDDSSPASDVSSRPVSRNLSFGTITTAQLASAIASVTTQQPQPSTSGASTSTANTGNTVEPISAPPQQSEESDMSSQLQIMRDMGLLNDALNREALQLSGDIGIAVDLILSGFDTSNVNRPNI